MELVTIEARANSIEYSKSLCEHLERGDILILENTPFKPSEDDCEFLRSQKQSSSGTHKNIAYKPHLDKTSGVDESQSDGARLHQILSTYSKGAVDYLGALFPQYSATWKVDYASFRPLEEQGRDLPLNARNDLMHVDAFPTRPTQGGRILRAFINIHPDKARVWGVSDDFPILAEKYAKDAGLDKAQGTGGVKGVLGKLIGQSERSAYDEFMLGFHTYLKANEDFQKNGVRRECPFPPSATWICFTDGIAHKASSGQYALEQTFIVPRGAMLLPELSPISVLEKIANRPLAAAR